MTVAFQKKLLWFLLLMGIGSILLFTTLMITKGPPNGREQVIVYSWVALAAAAIVFAWLRLRTCYHLESAQRVGYWHLSLGDFFIATFFAAGCMALWKGMWAASFLFWGAGISVLAGVGMILSLLAASWRGYTRYAVRILLAVGLLSKNFGKLVVGAVLSFAVLILFAAGPGEMIRFLGEILFERFMRFEWFETLVRIGALALPLGWSICRYVECNVEPDTKREKLG